MSRNRKPTRNLTSPGKNLSSDVKLTRAALLLSYQFEYGINFQERVITITDEIDDSTFHVIDNAMTQMESESKADITIKVSSIGGDVYAAMSIVARMRESKCKIITKGYGCVMSAATLILAAGTRRREVSSETVFMWHEASYETGGRHSEIKALVEQQDREHAMWADRMARYSKKDKRFWAKKGVGLDAYYTPEELLSFGVVDEIF